MTLTLTATEDTLITMHLCTAFLISFILCAYILLLYLNKGNKRILREFIFFCIYCIFFGAYMIFVYS